tara:strand:+ start:1841 stop:2038 length:198 start_codon:yes stop_codon:yes gene_type:complete
MKLTGNLDQLTKTSGNKRDQIVELPAAEKNGAVKGSKPTGRPRLLQTEEKLVKVWLDAPESVKRR